MADDTRDVQEREPAEVEHPRNHETVAPAVDIYESDEGTLLIADVPGCDENSVEVRLEEGVLTVVARAADKDYPDHDATFTEYRHADFERAFTVSELIDTDHIEATVKDGVLRLTLPKREAAKPKKIAIKTG